MSDVNIEAKRAEARRVIDLLGGTVKTAELCEVTKGAVSQWFNNGIPRTQLKFLKSERPDLFPVDALAADLTPHSQA